MRPIYISLTALAAVLYVSCNGRGASDRPIEMPVVVEEQTPAKEPGASAESKQQRQRTPDEMALNADDLDAQAAIGVLETFYTRHCRFQSEQKAKSDMETMRKYVDVYDIVASNHGKDFRNAVSRRASQADSLDLAAAYRQFVDRLSQYEGAALSDTPPAARVDTLSAVGE